MNITRMLTQTRFVTPNGKTIGNSLQDFLGPLTGTNTKHVTQTGILGKTQLAQLIADLLSVSLPCAVMQGTMMGSLVLKLATIMHRCRQL